MGSRATITDVVSLISGSREYVQKKNIILGHFINFSSSSFPLYAKGVDRYRFEFGVFLLNKNIEQVKITSDNVHYTYIK